MPNNIRREVGPASMASARTGASSETALGDAGQPPAVASAGDSREMSSRCFGGLCAMVPEAARDSWEFSLRKYLLLLATLIGTITYTAGFNPPGGVWQDTDEAAGRLAGDPIIRSTSYSRYLAFFYTNAAAFASSLVVIVLILILALLHEKKNASLAPLHILRFVMVLNLLSLMGAYAAGTCRDVLTTVYSFVVVFLVVVYVVVQMVLAAKTESSTAIKDQKRSKDVQKQRKALMLLATFAVSVTYLAGLNAPGGFWDNSEGGHRPGVAVLKGRHDARLEAFFIFNTTAFVASLLIIVLLLDKNLRLRIKIKFEDRKGIPRRLYACIILVLSGLMGAYASGSCRQTDTSIKVSALVVACVLAFIVVQVFLITYFEECIKESQRWQSLAETSKRCGRNFEKCIKQSRLRRLLVGSSNNCLSSDEQQQTQAPKADTGVNGQQQTQKLNKADEKKARSKEKASSLVLLLATLAATITYQAGLDPPGGLWENDGERYKAGDPILLTTNPRRYKAFFYCNSVAFVASLVAIILVKMSLLLKYHALEAAMILDLFGLIGAYAAGSCRDVSTSIYAIAMAGAVLVYVVIHVVFFTLDQDDNNNRRGNFEDFRIQQQREHDLLEKRRKRLLLFAILAATITYQAGLTPPSGFRLQDDSSGHHAGDPVLLYNYPRRYKTFFYCNSVSFMLSIALIILLVNPNIYRPAIRSNALSICTASGMLSLVGAYAAGSTQHLKTSIYIFTLVVVVLIVVVVIVVYFAKHLRPHKALQIQTQEITTTQDTDESHAKRKYLMLLGILAASVTYQAGLKPPGGMWQNDGVGHAAGNPIMYTNRRLRYQAFFYINSISFVASIIVIILLQLKSLKEQLSLRAMNTTIALDLIGLLVAYAIGSSRSWKTTGYVLALVVAVLAYIGLHVLLSCFISEDKNDDEDVDSGHQTEKSLGA